MHVVARPSVGGGSAGVGWSDHFEVPPAPISDRCRVVAARQNPVHVSGDGLSPSITLYSSASRGDP